MKDSDAQTEFAINLKKRFDDLAKWAVDNDPDTAPPLALADFDAIKMDIAAIADRGLSVSERDATAPDPSEGGAQYVNVNPAPWP